jgi:hypothetical protein
MTTPHIEHADLSDLIQRCLEADKSMEVVAHSGVDHVTWCHAAAAHDSIQALLSELRRIAKETS